MGRSSFSDYGYVPLVVEAPRRVAHQAYRAVAPAPGHRRACFDRGAQVLRRLAGELGERSSDGVQDVRVRAAQLRAAQAHVEPVRELVEEVEPGRGVLDLDRVK